MQPNDVILFYAMRQVAGVIGYGTMKTKFRQTQPLWPQEIAKGEVIWPLRFEIKVDHCIPPDRWESERIAVLDRLKEHSCRDAHEHNLDEGLQCSRALFYACSQNSAFIGIEQKCGQFIRL